MIATGTSARRPLGHDAAVAVVCIRADHSILSYLA